MKYQLLLWIFCLLAVMPVCAENGWIPVEQINTGSRIPCRILEPLGPDENARMILGDISEDDWILGNEDAPLTVIEYSDFECPYCAPVGLDLIETARKYPDRIRYVYRHFPLSFHEYAPVTAYAADAAGKQGLFFEAEYFLYSNQAEWKRLGSIEDVDVWLRSVFADSLKGLDYEKWLSDFESDMLRSKIDGEYDRVLATGLVGGTPALFFNFNNYTGSGSEEIFLKYASFFEMQSRLYTSCPAMLVDDAYEYRAVINTSAGKLTAELFSDMPMSVSSFITLATDGWYDRLKFHRIVPGYVAQTGDPSGIGIGNAGYYYDNESSCRQYGEPGLVGAANSGVNNNGAQFFITYDLNAYYAENLRKYYPELDEDELADSVASHLKSMSENYPIFGKITEETLPVLYLIDEDTVISSISIEKKLK